LPKHTKIDYLMENTFRLTVSILILTFFLNGCAYSEWVMPKEERLHRREMKKLLLADWSGRESERSEDGQWGNCFDMSEPESFKNSQCHSNEFEVYQIGKNMGTAVNTVTAFYCPGEKKYWVSQCVGDMALRGRWLGPFDLAMPATDTSFFPSKPESIRLSQAREKFPAEYQDAIAKTAAWFVKAGDDPSDWLIDIRQEGDSRLGIYMSHISGVKRVLELKKQGEYLLGNASGRDGRCTYDLAKKELFDCGLWE